VKSINQHEFPQHLLYKTSRQAHNCANYVQRKEINEK